MEPLKNVTKFIPRKINIDNNNNIDISSSIEINNKSYGISNFQNNINSSVEVEEVDLTPSSLKGSVRQANDSINNVQERLTYDDLVELASSNAAKILGRRNDSKNSMSDLDMLGRLSLEDIDGLLEEYSTYLDRINEKIAKETDKNTLAMLNMSKRSIKEYLTLLGYAKETKTEEFQSFEYNDVSDMSYDELSSFYYEYISAYDKLNNFPSNEDIARWNKYSDPKNTLVLLEYAKRYEEVEGTSLTVNNADSYQGLFPSINSDLFDCYDLMSDTEKKLLLFKANKSGSESGEDYISSMLPSWRQRVAYKNISERINNLTFASEEEIKEFDILLNMQMDIPLDKINDMSLPVYRTPEEYEKLYDYEMKLSPEQRISNLINPEEYERKYKVAYEKASDELYQKYENGLVKSDLSNLFDLSVSGLNDGINSFFDGVGKAFATNGELTISDYERLMYMSYLEGNSNGLEDFYQLSSAVGNMIPITTAGVMMAFVAPSYSAKIAQGMMFSSAYGNTANQMMYQGYDPKLSIFYGLASASTEVALESVGGIFGISENVSKNILVNMGKEGLEEAIQSAVQLGVIDRVMLGKTVNLDEITDEMSESFISGALVAGVLNSYSSTLANTIDFVYNGSSYTLSLDDFENILKLKNESNLSYEKAFSSYIQNITQNDLGVLQDLKRFNLEKFYTEDQNGGIIIITPNQTLGAQTADNGAGEHGDRVNDIYNLIYKNYKPIESAWQYDPKNGNNIIIQLCTGCESIVWLPDNINSYQLNILKYFNNEINSIQKNTNITGFSICDRKPWDQQKFRATGTDLSSAINEGSKRINNNIKGSDIVLDLSTLDMALSSGSSKSTTSTKTKYVRGLDANTSNNINNLKQYLVSRNNNEIVVDFLCLALEDSYKRGNNDVDYFINNIYKNGMHFELGDVGTGSKSWGTGIISIDPKNIANNDYKCLIHEIGHQFNDKVNHRVPPSNWMDTMKTMQQVANYSKNSVINQIYDRMNVRNSESSILFDELLRSEGYERRVDYYNYLNDKYRDVGFFQKGTLKKELKSYGVKENIIKGWSSGKISASAVADAIIDARVSSLDLMSSMKTGDILVFDIIDAVYLGKATDAYGNSISGHGSDYYRFNPSEDSYDEIMANYIALKMSNDTQALNDLTKVFGSGFIQTLDNEYNKLVK